MKSYSSFCLLNAFYFSETINVNSSNSKLHIDVNVPDFAKMTHFDWTHFEVDV